MAAWRRLLFLCLWATLLARPALAADPDAPTWGFGYVGRFDVHDLAPHIDPYLGVNKSYDDRVSNSAYLHGVRLVDETGLLTAFLGTAGGAYLARDTALAATRPGETATYSYPVHRPVPGQRTVLEFSWGEASGFTAQRQVKDKFGPRREIAAGVFKAKVFRYLTSVANWKLEGIGHLALNMGLTWQSMTWSEPGNDPSDGGVHREYDGFYIPVGLSLARQVAPQLFVAAHADLDPFYGLLNALADETYVLSWSAGAQVAWRPLSALVLSAELDHNQSAGGTGRDQLQNLTLRGAAALLF